MYRRALQFMLEFPEEHVGMWYSSSLRCVDPHAATFKVSPHNMGLNRLLNGESVRPGEVVAIESWFAANAGDAVSPDDRHAMAVGWMVCVAYVWGAGNVLGALMDFDIFERYETVRVERTGCGNMFNDEETETKAWTHFVDAMLELTDQLYVGGRVPPLVEQRERWDGKHTAVLEDDILLEEEASQSLTGLRGGGDDDDDDVSVGGSTQVDDHPVYGDLHWMLCEVAVLRKACCLNGGHQGCTERSYGCGSRGCVVYQYGLKKAEAAREEASLASVMKLPADGRVKCAFENCEYAGPRNTHPTVS